MANTLIWRYTDPYSGAIKNFSLDGNVSGLVGATIKPLFGKAGFLLPPVNLLTDKIPRRPGDVLRERVIEPRRVDIPFLIEATDYTQLVEVQRKLSDALSLDYGELIFNYAGRTRKLTKCTYIDGMMGDDGDDGQFVVWAKMLVSFMAHDPFFYEDTPVSDTSTLDETAFPEFFDTNFLDSMLSVGTIGDSLSINNDGASDAWPIWTITGPMGAGVKIGLEGGYSFTINKTIKEGEVVTVDTRPGEKTVISTFNGNIFSYLSNTSVLWAFPRGSRRAKFTVSSINRSSQIGCFVYIPYNTM